MLTTYACVCLGMSKEAGQHYPGASPQPPSSSTGYSRAATNHTPTGIHMAAEDTEHRAVGDGSRIGAWHGDAKENINSAFDSDYSHDKVYSVAAVIIALL